MSCLKLLSVALAISSISYGNRLLLQNKEKGKGCKWIRCPPKHKCVQQDNGRSTCEQIDKPKGKKPKDISTTASPSQSPSQSVDSLIDNKSPQELCEELGQCYSPITEQCGYLAPCPAFDYCSEHSSCNAYPDAQCNFDGCGRCGEYFTNVIGEVITWCDQNICTLSPQVGFCKAAIPRYYYNFENGKCESFVYGGCGGNANNFQTLLDCQLRCDANTEIPDCVPDGWSYVGDADVCSRTKYICSNSQETWFDASCGCGCKPNIKDECLDNGGCISPMDKTCQTEVLCFADPCQVTKCDAFPNAICESNYCGGCHAIFKDAITNRIIHSKECDVVDNDDICELKYEVGLCDAIIPRYTYNYISKQCQLFDWGGCGGNGNNFETLEECENACVSESENDNICQLRKDVGPCEALVHKYYYNALEEQCELFIFGGCDGNANNFETLDECQSFCMENITVIPDCVPDDSTFVGDLDFCIRALFICEDGQQQWFDNECGCGCEPINNNTFSTQIPDCAPNHVIFVANTELCKTAKFACDDGYTHWFDESCGCGCEKIEKENDGYCGYNLAGNARVCALIGLDCAQGFSYWSRDCGCGCHSDCVPNGYIMYGDSEECPLIDFICPQGQDHWSLQDCGCGCKPSVPECTPEGGTWVADPIECTVVRYACQIGEEGWSDIDCGCGCKPIDINPELTSSTYAETTLYTSTAEPTVPDCVPERWTYVGDNERCSVIRFVCDDDFEYWSRDNCGCGCRPKKPVIELPNCPLDGYTLIGDREYCQRNEEITCDDGYNTWRSHCGCGCKPECVPNGYSFVGDSEECSFIRFACDEGQEYWSESDCGCGCYTP